MTTDDVVVDVSQDWVLACDAQQRFMQGLGRTSDSVDRSAQCRQVRAPLGGDCYDFVPLTDLVWGWSLAMLWAKVSPRRS
jgi:serine phosphatase RsbU (regulator of sigma subunit)